MKRMILLTPLVLSVVASLYSPHSRASIANTAGGDWFFLVVEARVHPTAFEVDSDHPEERRWYISNVLPLPDDIPSYSAKKKAIEYFDANVVEPAKKQGITVDYYDQELEINGGSVVAVGSRSEADEMRKRDIEDRKEQGGNIYSFDFTFGPAKGEETSKPHLLYRNKEQPNYEPARSRSPGVALETELLLTMLRFRVEYETYKCHKILVAESLTASVLSLMDPS